MALTVLADKNIPHVHEAFRHVGNVRTMPGRAITRTAVQGADILLVRSITRVDANLLAGTCVQFVGSATIGTDHIDRPALHERGIAFAHARGAGAEAVVEYVTTALIVIASQEKISPEVKTLGIVGCGDIGSRVLRRARALGMRVLRNDPPLADASSGPHSYVELNKLLGESDVVTLHVPLTVTGSNATRHLISQSALSRMKPGAWLINTARGAVVDSAALGSALGHGTLGGAVLVVWENEPAPSLSLMRAASLATPHIAGHSYDGKLRGTILLYQAVTRHFGLVPLWNFAAVERPPSRLVLTPPADAKDATAWLDGLTRRMYDLRADDARTKTLLNAPPHALATRFSALRISYPRRRAFRWHQIPANSVPSALHVAVKDGLGVHLVP